MNPAQEFTLRVPATAANLGPGFDALGLALSLHNQFSVKVDVGLKQHYLVNIGHGDASLDDPEQNLFVRAYQNTCDAHDLPVLPLHVSAHNHIPLQSGLGSSASAIVAGVAAAYKVHAMPLDKALILQDALRLEPHPDNLSACLYGGFTISAVTDLLPLVSYTRLGYPLVCWVLHPHRSVDTVESRRRMPNMLSRADVVFSLSRASLLVASLIKGDLSMLGEVMKDKLHEPWRMDAAMEYPLLKEHLRGPEFYGWAISGSGPSVIALCSAVTDRMAQNVERHFAAHQTTYDEYRLQVDNDGLVVT